MARPADPNAREALLDAARLEFARVGLEHARIEDIAKRAGLSKGAFYLHFPSKGDAFRELVLRLFGVIEDQHARRHEAEASFERANGPLEAVAPGAWPERFAAVIELELQCDLEMLETFWRHREILAATQTAQGEPYRALLEDFHRRLTRTITGDLQKKIVAGRIRGDLDVEALTDLLIGAYDHFLRRMVVLKEKPDLRAWARTICTVLCDGMFPRPPGLAALASPVQKTDAVGGAPSAPTKKKLTRRSGGRSDG